MSPAAAAAFPPVVLHPRPLPLQRPVLDSAARWKLARWGRRASKTRVGVIAGTTGHGPRDPETGRPLRIGMAQGGKIGWLVRDYPQADEVWNEVIKPRFTGLPGFTLLDTDRLLIGPGGGTLQVSTNRNIASVRGKAKDGWIIDEGAWFALEFAWTVVLRPTLVDRKGWAMFLSTTNAGQDGNAEHKAPSYFNRLCQLALAGKLGADWQHFYATGYDNPVIDPAELDSIRVELGGPSSPTWQQEYLALLITGGAGLAFPEFDDRVHVVQNRAQLPGNWAYAASLDWGYQQGAYHLWGVDPDGRAEVLWEYYSNFKRLHAREAARAIFSASAFLPSPSVIFYDNQMDQDPGIKAGVHLADEWRAGMQAAFGGDTELMPRMHATAKGPGSRIVKKNMLHRYLAYQPIYDPATGEKDPATGLHVPGTQRLVPWARPKIRINQRCTGLITELKALPLSVDDPEDVDTDAPDHAYDSACLFLMGRPELSPTEQDPTPIDRSPESEERRSDGRRKRWETMASAQIEADRDTPYSGASYDYVHSRDLEAIEE